MRAALLLLALLAAPAFADSPDVVRLKNGGLLRGTISELVPGEKVIIVLPTGEVRTVPAAEIDYAGPVGAASFAPSAGELPTGAQVPVKLVAESGDLTFYLPIGKSVGTSVGATVGTGAVGVGAGGSSATSFRRLCIAPCATQLPEGRQRLAVGEGEDPPVTVDEAVNVAANGTLVARYTSLAPVRVVGTVISLAALGVGLGLGIEWAARGEANKQSPDFTQPAVGLGVALGGGIIGLILGNIDDRVEIRATP